MKDKKKDKEKHPEKISECLSKAMIYCINETSYWSAFLFAAKTLKTGIEPVPLTYITSKEQTQRLICGLIGL